MIVSEATKRRARAAANYAFPVAQPCEACGAVGGQRHHHDYSRPLDIRWLCDPCHRAEHRRKPGHATATSTIRAALGWPPLKASA